MDLTSTLFGIHAVATLMMMGLIWFVQIVHYPLFAQVGELNFQQFELEHQKRTGIVVAPAMLIELGSSVVLLFVVDESLRSLAFIGVALVSFLWLWTFLLMAPQHRRFGAAGAKPAGIRRLVLTNWPRTIAWSARGVIAALLPVLAPAA